MTKDNIKNEALRRLITMKAGKLDFEEVTEDDIAKIQSISIGGKSINGKPLEVDFHVLELFPELSKLIISDVELNQDDVDAILNVSSLKDIEVCRCECSKVSFDELGERTIMFQNCPMLPARYPKTKRIVVSGSRIDFNTIDLNAATDISIISSDIFNAHDINYYSNIQYVNFDGSTLYSNYQQRIPNIRVSQLTEYSHKDQVQLCGAELSL